MIPDAPIQAAFDLLVVGEVNPDVVVTDPDPTPRFGQAERLVQAVRLVIGSSSVIAACGAARLGLRVAMVGVVGDDPLGRFMLDAMVDRGIDVSGVRVVPDRPTGASVILGNGRDRAILTALGTIADVRAADVPPALLAGSGHVHVGSFFLQPGLARDLPDLFRAAHAAGATTSLDPNWDPAERWDGGFAAAAAVADILLPNEAEARRLTGHEELSEAAAALLALGEGGERRRAVAIKMGGEGGFAMDTDGAIARVTPPHVRPVDTTGAGDSFNAGFITAWREGATLGDALGLAVACGSLSTRLPGGTDAQPTRAEAAAAIATWPEWQP